MLASLAVLLHSAQALGKPIPQLEGPEPTQWRVIWKTDPATQATISWNTNDEGEHHRVHLLPAASAAEAENQGQATEQVWQMVDCQRNGRYTSNRKDKNRELYYHHARLSDLRPNTKYRVVMESDGHRSREMYFVTAPREDLPLSIVYGGDSCSGQARPQINAMIARLVAEQSAAGRPPVLAFAHGGDFVFDGRILAKWSRWMTDHELITGADGRLLPIIPTRGNHDIGVLFNEVFDFSAEDKNYYAMDIGPQLRMVTLNTETSTAGRQARWLEEELRRSRPAHRWLLAQYHRPAFPAVKFPSSAYTSWVPLFEKYNLDMACEADGHCIKRTAPIRNNRIDPTGVVYIGEGGLGVGQRTPKAGRWYLRSPHAKVGSGHHVQLLSATPVGLTYRVIMLDGTVFDEATLSPRTKHAASSPISQSPHHGKRRHSLTSGKDFHGG